MGAFEEKKVYATPPINVANMRIRITAEVNILKENPDLMKKVAQVCVNMNDNKHSCFQ